MLLITSSLSGKTDLIVLLMSSTEATATPFGTLFPYLPINSAPWHHTHSENLDLHTTHTHEGSTIGNRNDSSMLSYRKIPVIIFNGTKVTFQQQNPNNAIIIIINQINKKRNCAEMSGGPDIHGCWGGEAAAAAIFRRRRESDWQSCRANLLPCFRSSL